MSDPSNLIRTRITELPEDPAPDNTLQVVCVRNGRTYRATLAEALNAVQVPATRLIDTGTGLEGGGDLSADRTISLSDTTVTAGNYGSSTETHLY